MPIRAQAGTGWIANNTYMIAATGPLQPGTTYTVAVEGTLNGGAFTRSWSFTTLGAGGIVVPETGRSLSGRFLSYWQANGGLPVFGYPLTEEFAEGGRTVQYFERQRFEHHPQNAAPYDVLFGLLGVADAERRGLTGSAPFRPLPADTPSDANCDFFPETGHRLCWGFRTYWRGHGLDFGEPGFSYRESLALFGYPISEEFRMAGEDGREYTMQYFERARFEWHPQNPPPYDILLGRLGADLLAAQGPRVAVRDVRVGQHPAYTRIVVEADGPTTYRRTILTGPDRIVLDVDRAVLAVGAGSRAVADGTVREVRWAPFTTNPDVVRVVIELEGARPANVFTLDALFRIVVDVTR